MSLFNYKVAKKKIAFTADKILGNGLASWTLNSNEINDKKKQRLFFKGGGISVFASFQIRKKN